MELKNLLSACTGFEWDEGNASKSWEKHHVSLGEAEEVFFNQPLVVGRDVWHSRGECRFYALGETDASRRLFVVFTIRGELIRVISVRDMSRNERKTYESS